MDVISNNLANAQTTATPGGGPFREQMVVFTPIQPGPGQPGGVAVTAIVGDTSPFPVAYDPGNPAANAQGYVREPNVNVTAQMVDLLAAQQAYSANATAFSDSVIEQQQALKI